MELQAPKSVKTLVRPPRVGSELAEFVSDIRLGPAPDQVYLIADGL